MNRYENGKIYKITDIGYNKCYIGSTTESLSQRMVRHRAYYFRYLRDGKMKMRSTLLLDEYGADNCKIELIELYPCNSRYELLRKEGEHIRNNECVNKVIAGRTVQEYREDNKESISAKAKIYKEKNYEKLKQKRDQNAEERNEKNKQYHEANKDKVNERHRQHYHDNKEGINARHKANYEKNKEKVLANQARKVQCICGTTHRKGDKSKHEKSKKHQRYLQEHSHNTEE